MPQRTKSESLFQLRLRRFRRIKTGYYSFVILASAYLATFFLSFLVGHRALFVSYEGKWYFPAAASFLHDTFGITREVIYPASDFNQETVRGNPNFGEVNYRVLQEELRKSGNGFVVMPPYPYGPFESFLHLPGRAPHRPTWEHIMGTDVAARDVFARLVYGFRISITFALLVTLISYVVGVLVGAALGYFGGWVDLVALRFVEIWGSVPMLYTIIIIASLFKPNFTWLVIILAAFGWLSIVYYVRGEVYREKARDYVAAAIVAGESSLSVIVRHVLPNALTPVVSFAPFAVVANIVALVSLDFLGFGLRPPTPSWGELLAQDQRSFSDWNIVVFPLAALFITLQLVVFIGEAVREAFDPKQHGSLQ